MSELDKKYAKDTILILILSLSLFALFFTAGPNASITHLLPVQLYRLLGGH
jgi:hypothetical protein